MEPDVENFLAHFGVKGMHWGQRKDLRRAALSNFASVTEEVNSRQNQARYFSSLTDAQYKKLSTNKVIVKQGNLVKRTTTNPLSDQFAKELFVSKNENDANNYRAALPSGPQGVAAKKYKGYYETTLEATRDLSSPSEKTRVDAYIRLMGVPEVKLQTGENVTGREYMRRQGLAEAVDKMSNKQIALTYYGQLVVAQGIRNEPLNTAYFNSMKQKGYNAMIDDNDRGILVREPLLSLDARQDLKTVSVKQLTTEDIHRAQASMVLPG